MSKEPTHNKNKGNAAQQGDARKTTNGNNNNNNNNNRKKKLLWGKGNPQEGHECQIATTTSIQREAPWLVRWKGVYNERGRITRWMLKRGVGHNNKYGVKDTNANYLVWVATISTVATEQFNVLMFLKQTGSRFDRCHSDLRNNNFLKGSNHIPETVLVLDNGYALLQNYKTSDKNTSSSKNKHQDGKRNGDHDGRGFQWRKSCSLIPTKKGIRFPLGVQASGRKHIPPQCTETTTIDGEKINHESNNQLYGPSIQGTMYERKTRQILGAHRQAASPQSTYSGTPCGFCECAKNSKDLELHTNTGTAIIDEVGDLLAVGPEANAFKVDYTSCLNKKAGFRDKSFQPRPILLGFEEHFGVNKSNTVFGSELLYDNQDDAMEIIGTQVPITLMNQDIETVEGNEALRRFQYVVSHPSNSTLIVMATKNTIKDSSFVPSNVKVTKTVLGLSMYRLKGKIPKRKNNPVERTELMPLPATIEEHYKEVVMAADLMHVNQVPMLATISRGLHYDTSIAALSLMKLKKLEGALISVFRAYSLCGFRVISLLVDKQFEGLTNNLAKAEVMAKGVSKEEHVPEIKCFIQVIKERGRANYTMLPFNKIPRKMVMPLLSVSQELSPTTIVKGRVSLFQRDFHVIFGEYAQTYEGTDNNMQPRTIGAIALGPIGNIQGSVPPPMPSEAIKRVERMTRRSRSRLTFGDRNNNKAEDSGSDEDEDDKEYLLSASEHNFTLEDTSSSAEDYNSDDESTDTEGSKENSKDNEAQSEPEDSKDEASEEHGMDIITGVENEDGVTEEDDMNNSYKTSSGLEEVRSTQSSKYVYKTIRNRTMGVKKPASTTQKIKKIHHANDQKNFIQVLDYINKVEHEDNFINDYVMTQMNIQEGLQVHGEKGKTSIMKEIRNLKKQAQPILMFMLVKCDGQLKSRGCTDGRPQCLWTNKQDNSSPATPAAEALKYILAINGMENQDVAVFDLPAQFLQTDMDTLLFLKVTRALALLLVEKERGRPMMYYVQCKKATYGTLNAAILAYKKLVGYFKEWGLEMNPYKACIWNKMTNGSHHKDAGCVTNFLVKQLDEVYGKTDPLTICQGKVHEYLGMTLDFSKPGEVMITMNDYIKMFLGKILKEMVGERATAAPEYLFQTNKSGAMTLPKDQSKEFHTLTATVLYLAIQTCTDLQLAGQESHAVHIDMKEHGGLYYATEGKGGMVTSSIKLKLNTVNSAETKIVTVGEKLPKCMRFRRIAQGGLRERGHVNARQPKLHASQEATTGTSHQAKGVTTSTSKKIRYRIKKKHVKVEYCPVEEIIADFFIQPLQGALFHKSKNAILGINAAVLEYDLAGQAKTD
eukprot:jgi/Psemu1/1685/gm1.1685_g